MFIRFDKMHEHDRHTDSAWRHRPRLHSIARQKCSSGLFRQDIWYEETSITYISAVEKRTNEWRCPSSCLSFHLTPCCLRRPDVIPFESGAGFHRRHRVWLSASPVAKRIATKRDTNHLIIVKSASTSSMTAASTDLHVLLMSVQVRKLYVSQVKSVSS